eukprot:CAMPEP_0182416374 /NCGR_PEP_ID=MMETSP1167-20130531/650_1 /TAXON_ID=2988 /ORGANISM="Mallomonas Sp, Strain CCMP3275" /LENGTH=424 /DNA_ID=CAMNT_0024589077 /DNA_START=135 /DNA_END=1409 /DNA_ORIENTATION=+
MGPIPVAHRFHVEELNIPMAPLPVGHKIGPRELESGGSHFAPMPVGHKLKFDERFPWSEPPPIRKSGRGLDALQRPPHEVNALSEQTDEPPELHGDPPRPGEFMSDARFSPRPDILSERNDMRPLNKQNEVRANSPPQFHGDPPHHAEHNRDPLVPGRPGHMSSENRFGPRPGVFAERGGMRPLDELNDVDANSPPELHGDPPHHGVNREDRFEPRPGVFAERGAMRPVASDFIGEVEHLAPMAHRRPRPEEDTMPVPHGDPPTKLSRNVIANPAKEVAMEEKLNRLEEELRARASSESSNLRGVDANSMSTSETATPPTPQIPTVLSAGLNTAQAMTAHLRGYKSLAERIAKTQDHRRLQEDAATSTVSIESNMRKMMLNARTGGWGRLLLNVGDMFSQVVKNVATSLPTAYHGSVFVRPSEE